MKTKDLSERHNIEEHFHDERTRSGTKRSARTLFCGLGAADEYSRKLIEAAGSLEGKRVMGAARVDGFDLSSERLSVSQRNVARDGLADRVFFRHLAAEDIDYADESFDVVLGKAILHHTDMEKTSRQLARVLRPGGEAYFLEPLGHNPFLNLFRKLTARLRTPTETPLRMKDLDVFRQHFEFVSYRGFHLLAMMADRLLLVTGSKKVSTKCMTALVGWDDRLLRRLPFLQKYCWTALMVFKKGPSSRDKSIGQLGSGQILSVRPE
jgi:SAM-dependent methyltransferase